MSATTRAHAEGMGKEALLSV